MCDVCGLGILLSAGLGLSGLGSKLTCSFDDAAGVGLSVATAFGSSLELILKSRRWLFRLNSEDVLFIY